MPQIIASNSGGTNYEPIAAGNYVARCVSMILIGTVEEEFAGKKKMLEKVKLSWELPGELKEFKEGEGEKPYILSKDFTLSMFDKANLRKYLESWRGKGFTDEEAEAFDITKLMGAACMLNVIHTVKGTKTYANISGVSTMPKGLTCPPQITPTLIFSVRDFDQKVFETLPSFIQDKIKTSVEYKQMETPNNFQSEPEHDNETPVDDLPF